MFESMAILEARARGHSIMEEVPDRLFTMDE
jgi:hypothetical protein